MILDVVQMLLLIVGATRDTTAFIATCVCVPVGLYRLATVWNSDSLTMFCNLFWCIMVTFSTGTDASDLNAAEYKNVLYYGKSGSDYLKLVAFGRW